MHRSGTTFLQRLLSVDTRSRSTKLFELWNDGVKFRAASRAEYENDDISLVAPVTKKVKMLDALFKSRGENRFRLASHHFAADLPEEIYFVLEDTAFLSPLYGVYLAHNPQAQARFYNSFFGPGVSHRDVALYCKRYLQCLASGYTPESHWVLKDPQLHFYLDDLRAEFPDMSLIFCHRDPVISAASTARMVYDLTAMFQPDWSLLSPLEIGRNAAWSCRAAQNKALEYAAAEARGEVPRAFHMNFNEFVRDPIAMVERIYAHFNFGMSAGFRTRMERYIRGNPQHKLGKVPYSLEMFGLTPDDVLVPG